jgi:hypothetical protein
MRPVVLSICVGVGLLAAPTFCNAADIVLFDNGPFITGVGTGPNGSDVSVTESGAAISISFNAGLAPPNGPVRVADDFVVSGAPGLGARLSHMYVYGVQSNSTTSNVQFGAAYVAIYDGQPSAGGNLIAGDFDTNRALSSTWTGAYRLSSGGTPSTTRPITRIDVDMSWAPPLRNGTYWIVFSAIGDASLSSSPNPQTIVVTPHRATDNAQQLFNGNWVNLYDLPFVVHALCPADFNASHSTTVGDIFDFLNAWFAGNPLADFNGNGIAVSDIFDFLNQWFTGC